MIKDLFNCFLPSKLKNSYCLYFLFQPENLDISIWLISFGSSIEIEILSISFFSQACEIYGNEIAEIDFEGIMIALPMKKATV